VSVLCNAKNGSTKIQPSNDGSPGGELGAGIDEGGELQIM
jgi:hypothetical protein